jgi:hypothetical protein
MLVIVGQPDAELHVVNVVTALDEMQVSMTQVLILYMRWFVDIRVQGRYVTMMTTTAVDAIVCVGIKYQIMLCL